MMHPAPELPALTACFVSFGPRYIPLSFVNTGIVPYRNCRLQASNANEVGKLSRVTAFTWGLGFLVRVARPFACTP